MQRESPQLRARQTSLRMAVLLSRLGQAEAMAFHALLVALTWKREQFPACRAYPCESNIKLHTMATSLGNYDKELGAEGEYTNSAFGC